MFSLKNITKSAAVLSTVLIFFASYLLAQHNNRFDEPISDEHYKFLEEKKAAIIQEISADKSGKTEWTGTYLLGDHHPTIFMWSADQGFLTWGSNHTFYPARINFGKAEFSNDRLIITPEIEKTHLNFQYIPTELIPVKWGEHHFLIGSDELLEFAYAVHSGAESQIINFLIKTADFEKSRTGLPNLPKEYEKILTMQAIKPKVIAIKPKAAAIKKEDDSLLDTELTLNRGRADMLVKGMYLYFVNSSGSLTIRITDLDEKSSKAVIAGFGQTANKEMKPKIGMKFSSKVPEDFVGY